MMLAATHECIYCLLYLPAQVCVLHICQAFLWERQPEH